MPLTGTRCCQTDESTPFAHCLHEARNFRCDYPLALIKYMAGNEEARKGIDYSATSIIGCARRQILQKDHDFYESPKDAIPRFGGDAAHDYTAALLGDEMGYEGERRVYKDIEVDGIRFRLSAKPDQEWDRTIVVDLKNTGRIPKVPYPEHEAQVNIYAWMLRGGEDVDAGRGLDFPYKVWRRITAGYITYVSTSEKDTVTYPVTIWPDEAQEAYIHERLRPYVPFITAGVLPEILSPTIRYAPKSGRPLMKRDWKCDYCPVRGVCDNKAYVDTGLDPNKLEYWERDEPDIDV